MGERLSANGLAVRVNGLLFGRRRVFVVVPEVISMCPGLPEAVAQAPVVEVEYRRGSRPAEAELNLAAVLVLREICESDPRLTLLAGVWRAWAF